jgi:MFS family permease
LLASAVTTTVRHALTEDQLNDYGWRIPFWFSLVLAPLLFLVVINTEESKFWEERNAQKETEQLIREVEETTRPAFLDLLDSPFRRRQLAGMIGGLSAVNGSFYILFLWTPVYLSELRGLMSEKDADLLNTVVVCCYIFFLLIAGNLSDKFPHRMDLVRIGLPGIIVGCPTMFGMFESESWWGYLWGQLQFAACLSMVQGCMGAWQVELWMADPTLSFTAVAIGHNVASTLFGGTMPLIATFLYYRSAQLAADNDAATDAEDVVHSLLPRLIPGFYISILGIISFYCVSSIVRHPHDIRIGEIKLRSAVQEENRKYKEVQAANKAKKNQRTVHYMLEGKSSREERK